MWQAANPQPLYKVIMHCPECSYDLKGCSGKACPECGTAYSLIANTPQKVPYRLLYMGIGFVGLYCVAQTVWFWQELSLFNAMAIAGGSPDPLAMAGHVRIALWAHYGSNLCLGVGLTCIAIALFSTFRQVVLVLSTRDSHT